MSKSDKAFIGNKIKENNGVIKSTSNDADFIIVNEGVFEVVEDKQRRSDQSKGSSLFSDRGNTSEFTTIFNYMNACMAQEERLSQPVDLSKSINFIHGSNYKSRIAKLVTQAPKKQQERLQQYKETPQKIRFTNVFEFLANEKWNLLTLNDLYDIINRQESLKQNKEWFKKRLRPFIKEQGEFEYKSLFCVASFYRLNDGYERELDHISHFHQFDEMSEGTIRQATIQERVYEKCNKGVDYRSRGK